MENFIRSFIYLHAALGGIALLSGTISVIVKKGSKQHKNFGKAFYFSMISSIVISLILSCLPNHHNPFLFSIGLFSLYFILMGKRALHYKNVAAEINWERILILLMMLVGIAMIFYPIIVNQKINFITLTFGAFGVFCAWKDWWFIHDRTKWKSSWLFLHVSRITGGYIASVTAFLVVNDVLPGISEWFLPGIIGGVYIYYWGRRLKSKNKVNSY